MFSEVEYQTVWMIYLAAAVCGWLVWWRMTRLIGWWFIREPLQVIMAVLLFTPAQVDPLVPWLAPAFMIWLSDMLLNTGDNAGRMLGDLTLTMVVALVAYVGFACLSAAWRHWRGGQGASARPTDQ